MCDRVDVGDELLFELELALEPPLLRLEGRILPGNLGKVSTQSSQLSARIGRLEGRLLCFTLQSLNLLESANIVVFYKIDHLFALNNLSPQLGHFLRQVTLDDELLFRDLSLQAAHATLVSHVMLNKCLLDRIKGKG